MTLRLLAIIVATFALLLLSASCGGGGGSQQVTIVSINTNPGTVSAATIVALSASISAPGQSPAAMDKTWTVDQGELYLSPPDFSLIQKGASQGGAQQLVTTASTVYWLAPASVGTAAVSLAVAEANLTRNVAVSKSALSVAVTDAAEGKKVVTVNASAVDDLFQAAFRVNHSSAWRVETIERGSFLGTAEETLFLGLTSQNGFVPVAITRKGNAPGVDGSGPLAVITFEPTGAAASAAFTPFELSAPVLVTK